MKYAQRFFSILMPTLIFCTSALCNEAKPDPKQDEKWAGNLFMNGYSLQEYANFAKEWPLVTVRYRQDSGEFRFIYANDIAYKAIVAEAKVMPEGSILAKTAYRLGPDAAFPSSLVPQKVARYQLMVKDSKKHKDTDGWGYALFDMNGKTFAGDPKQVSLSCHACHTIVKNSDFIFVRLIEKNVNFVTPVERKQTVDSQKPKFNTIARADLPDYVQKHLPPQVRQLRKIGGALETFSFEGTLNEIRPFLAIESMRSKMPAILLNKKIKKFSLVFTDDKNPAACTSGDVKGHEMMSVVSVEPQSSGTVPYAALTKLEDNVDIRSFCALAE